MGKYVSSGTHVANAWFAACAVAAALFYGGVPALVQWVRRNWLLLAVVAALGIIAQAELCYRLDACF